MGLIISFRVVVSAIFVSLLIDGNYLEASLPKLTPLEMFLADVAWVTENLSPQRSKPMVDGTKTTSGTLKQKEGESIEFSCCFVDAFPSPTITWTRERLKEGAGQRAADGINITYYGDEDGAICSKLKITNINSMDTGPYMCKADNGVGDPVLVPNDLLVQFQPRILSIRNPNMTYTDGMNLTYQFYGPGRGETVVALKMNGTKFPLEDPRIKCSRSQRSPFGAFKVELHLPKEQTVGRWDFLVYHDAYGSDSAAYCIEAWELCADTALGKPALSKPASAMVGNLLQFSREKSTPGRYAMFEEFERAELRCCFVIRTQIEKETRGTTGILNVSRLKRTVPLILWYKAFGIEPSINSTAQISREEEPGVQCSTLLFLNVTRRDMERYNCTAILDGRQIASKIFDLDVNFQPEISPCRRKDPIISKARPGRALEITFDVEMPMRDAYFTCTSPSGELSNCPWLTRNGPQVRASLNLNIPSELAEAARYAGKWFVEVRHRYHAPVNTTIFVVLEEEEGAEAGVDQSSAGPALVVAKNSQGLVQWCVWLSSWVISSHRPLSSIAFVGYRLR